MNTQLSQGGQGRVLCVDDEPNILAALQRVFRGSGLWVRTASSGAEALGLLAADVYDVVISDMRMPEMNGAELLEAVRLRWPDTARIMLTGFSDASSTLAAINRAEIFRYLAKPWNDEELLHTVAQALERKRLKTERDQLLLQTQEQNQALARLNDELELRVTQRTEALAQANLQLHRAWLTSIKVFTGLMETRSGGLAGHGRRVAELARGIARQMRLTEQEQKDVFLGGLLHDVGKLGLPDAVLTKRLRDFSPAELAQYRQHITLGEQALMPLENLQAAASLVRSHHERFDGRGQPDGLHGEQIPLGARILALANDVDNMLNGRHSPLPMPVDVVRQRVIDSSENRYDPAVVAAWVALLNLQAATPDRLLSVTELRPGDVLAQDWTDTNGLLLLAAEQVLDLRLIEQIRKYQAIERQALRLYVHPRKESA